MDEFPSGRSEGQGNVTGILRRSRIKCNNVDCKVPGQGGEEKRRKRGSGRMKVSCPVSGPSTSWRERLGARGGNAW